jgi:hypothetical protein
MSRLIPLLLGLFLIVPVSAQTIKKCQDANGKWHYGDHAAFECEQSSRITEIDEEGRQVGEVEAPPTQEELNAKLHAERQLSEQEKTDANQKRLDRRLLITYENPESILLTRDALLAAIDSAVDADRDLRDQLTDELRRIEASGGPNAAENAASVKQQIADFDEAIQARLATKEIAKNRYEMEHRRYKELTGD